MKKEDKKRITVKSSGNKYVKIVLLQRIDQENRIQKTHTTICGKLSHSSSFDIQSNKHLSGYKEDTPHRIAIMFTLPFHRDNILISSISDASTISVPRHRRVCVICIHNNQLVSVMHLPINV